MPSSRIVLRHFKLIFLIILLFYVHPHDPQAINPVLSEFEDNRASYRSADHKRIMRKLDDVMTRSKYDPSLGFPVVQPQGEEAKVVRHILLYNRLSPPNSLRAAEFSAENEFYAWLDNRCYYIHCENNQFQSEIALVSIKNRNRYFPKMHLHFAFLKTFLFISQLCAWFQFQKHCANSQHFQICKNAWNHGIFWDFSGFWHFHHFQALSSVFVSKLLTSDYMLTSGSITYIILKFKHFQAFLTLLAFSCIST